MFKKTFFVAFLAISFFGVTAFQTIHAQQVNWRPPYQVPESYDYSIPYAGFTSFDPYGRPFIRFNPRIASQYPWFMNVFLRAHEYGHIFSRGPYPNPEANADCWAAQQLGQSDPQLLDMVIRYLETEMGPRGGEDGLHGNGYQVAKVCRQCSGR